MTRIKAWTCAVVMAAGGAWAQADRGPEVTPQLPRLEGNVTFRDKAPQRVRADIQARTRAFEQAFNAHDVRAMASQFTEDATYLDLRGEAVTGKSNIQQVLQEEHAGMLKEARIQLTVTSVRTLDSRLALVDMTGLLTGLPTGAKLPASFRATAVAARHGRTWQVEALRLFAVPGAEERGVGGAGRVDPTRELDSTATPPSGLGTSPLDQRNEDRLP